MAETVARPYTLWNFVAKNDIATKKIKWPNGYGWDFVFEKDGKNITIGYWDVTYYPLKVIGQLRYTFGIQ